jgi:hypothetical protein
MSDKRESFSSFGLHVAANGWATCHRYADQAPILVINAGESEVSVSIRGGDATEAAVQFARALARRAEEFAAEVERHHAAKAAPDKSADRAA